MCVYVLLTPSAWEHRVTYLQTLRSNTSRTPATMSCARANPCFPNTPFMVSHTLPVNWNFCIRHLILDLTGVCCPFNLIRNSVHCHKTNRLVKYCDTDSSTFAFLSRWLFDRQRTPDIPVSSGTNIYISSSLFHRARVSNCCVFFLNRLQGCELAQDYVQWWALLFLM